MATRFKGIWGELWSGYFSVRMASALIRHGFRWAGNRD
jgi:hypothetical protein